MTGEPLSLHGRSTLKARRPPSLYGREFSLHGSSSPTLASARGRRFRRARSTPTRKSTISSALQVRPFHIWQSHSLLGMPGGDLPYMTATLPDMAAPFVRHSRRGPSLYGSCPLRAWQPLRSHVVATSLNGRYRDRSFLVSHRSSPRIALHRIASRHITSTSHHEIAVVHYATPHPPPFPSPISTFRHTHLSTTACTHLFSLYPCIPTCTLAPHPSHSPLIDSRHASQPATLGGLRTMRPLSRRAGPT
jgi:hypothetical protein